MRVPGETLDRTQQSRGRIGIIIHHPTTDLTNSLNTLNRLNGLQEQTNSFGNTLQNLLNTINGY